MGLHDRPPLSPDPICRGKQKSWNRCISLPNPSGHPSSPLRRPALHHKRDGESESRGQSVQELQHSQGEV